MFIKETLKKEEAVLEGKVARTGATGLPAGTWGVHMCMCVQGCAHVDTCSCAWRNSECCRLDIQAWIYTGLNLKLLFPSVN